MTLPLTGTADVENGSDMVAWTGPALTSFNCVAGATIALDGRTYFVKERTDTNALQLTRNYAGAAGTVPAEIEQLSPKQVATATLNARAATVMSELSTYDANGRGLFYRVIGVTGDNDPGPGNLAFNAAAAEDVTEIYVDVLDANDGGRDVAGIIELWTPGTVLMVRSLATAAYRCYQLAAAPIGTGGYRKLEVTAVSADGDLAAEPVALDWSIVGAGIQIDYAGPFAERAGHDAAPAGKIFASINGAGGLGGPTVLYRKESAAAGDWGPAIPFQGPESEPRVAVTVWDPGRPGAGETIFSCVFDVPVAFPLGFASPTATSRARAGTAATAASAFSVRKNGAEIGTVTFAPAGTVGAFAGAGGTFAAGEQLTIVAPAVRDATLAQIAITIAGER